jgi:hypothetical protein
VGAPRDTYQSAVDKLLRRIAAADKALAPIATLDT